MIVPITVLTSLIFSVIYPLCFWIHFRDPLKNNFHKFHIGLPNVVGGITLVFLLLMNIPLDLKVLAVFWKMVFLAVSQYSWRKESPNPFLLTVPSVIGLSLFVKLQAYWIGPDLRLAVAGVLGGLIFCAVLYAMNLGHWYLNVRGLPLKHLRRAVSVAAFFLALRLVWDVYFLIQGKVLYAGRWISIARFMAGIDGFLLGLPLLFGLLFPLGALFFVYGTLKAQNPQSATGILYVILCSVLLGDIAYKYYMIRLGIFL